MFIAQLTEHEVCHDNTEQNECSQITDCLIFLQFLYCLTLGVFLVLFVLFSDNTMGFNQV